MGQDKAWLDLNGMPLVEHIARRVLPLADEIILSASDPAPFLPLITRLSVPARITADVFPAAGPLAGLHAGLRAAQHNLVFAVATDMPLIDRDLVRAMVALCGEADALIPRLRIPGMDEPQPEPLHALYRKTCLPAIETVLSRGRRSMISFLPDVTVRYLDEDELRAVDPELRSFRNVNTPEDWAAVKASLQGEDQNTRT